MRCKSICDVKPGLDPCPLLARSWNRWWLDFVSFIAYKKVKIKFKKAKCVSNRCNDLFRRKKYFWFRCTLMFKQFLKQTRQWATHILLEAVGFTSSFKVASIISLNPPLPTAFACYKQERNTIISNSNCTTEHKGYVKTDDNSLVIQLCLVCRVLWIVFWRCALPYLGGFLNTRYTVTRRDLSLTMWDL